MKTYKLFLLVSICVLLTCSIFIFFLDQPFTMFLFSYRKSIVIQGFDYIREGLTFYTLQIYLVFLVISVILFKKKHIFNFSFLLITDIICQLLTRLLKHSFGRSRPFSLIENDEYDFYWINHPNCGSLSETSYAYDFFDGVYCYDSFPSGHTSSAFCMAFSIGLLYPSLRPILLFYACSVAIGRVMTTIHYFSDIVFGAYLAFVVVYSIYAIRCFMRKKVNSLINK